MCSCECVMGTLTSRFSFFTEKRRKKRARARPVSNELHLWCSLPQTVIMHKTSNNHWFIFAFNYFLAQTLHVWLFVRETACVKVWEQDPQSALTGQRYFHPHLCIATQQQTTKLLLLRLKEQKVRCDPKPTFSHVQFALHLLKCLISIVLMIKFLLLLLFLQ